MMNESKGRISSGILFIYTSIISFIYFISSFFVASFSYIKVKETLVDQSKQKSIELQIEKAKEQRNSAKTYREWKEASERLDELQGFEEWKTQVKSNMYDSSTIEQRLISLRQLAEAKDYPGLMLALRSGLHRRLAGITNPELYGHCNIGTKYLIEDYVEEVSKHLKFFCDSHIEGFESEAKLRFFWETRQSYGRSALCLSGGATLGMYHLGVIKALWQEGLLPRIISGTSAGALVASIVATTPDSEFEKLFEPGFINFDAFDEPQKKGNPIKRRVSRLATSGVLLDIKTLEGMCRANIGNVTFKEAFEKTNRILNITVASTSKFEVPRILNYLTTPHVLIWSAACASCALVGLYEPVELLAKDHLGNVGPYCPSRIKWSDGTTEADLPLNRLAEMFNVNHFIVSQVNPHIIPFLKLEKWLRKRKFLRLLNFLVNSEISHRIVQITEAGLCPSWIQALITQRYEGDVTILPDVGWHDYWKLLSNPTEEFKAKCIQKGEQATWPQIPLIYNNCRIEATLEQCLNKLRKGMTTMLKNDSHLNINEVISGKQETPSSVSNVLGEGNGAASGDGDEDGDEYTDSDGHWGSASATVPN